MVTGRPILPNKRARARERTRRKTTRTRETPTIQTPRTVHPRKSLMKWSRLHPTVWIVISGKQCLRNNNKSFGTRSGNFIICQPTPPMTQSPKTLRSLLDPSKTRYVKNAQTNDSEADDDDDKDPDSGTISARVNSIMSSNRNLNVVICTSTCSHEQLLLIDGGADTCMMGKEFFIESRSGRTVTVEGFGGTDTSVRDMHMGTGITKVSFPGKDPFLL